MNSFLCLSLLFALASAASKPQSVPWAYSVSDETLKPGSWYDGGVSYVSPAAPTGYWPSYYSPSVHHSAEIAPKNWYLYKGHHSAPAVARSDSSEWKVEPVSWSDASYVPQPQSWSAGYYSAGVPVTAKVDKQIIAKKVVAPTTLKLDQVQPIADQAPKFISYSTEITHDVPAKKEEVSPIVPVARTISIPQVAPKVVSAPAHYSAWAGEVKPVAEIKPASWASEVKPASWASEVKPASWASEVKPASWASEVKPASWASEVKPASWVSEVKPASWSSEVKPGSWSSEVKPVGWTSEVKPASWTWAEPKPATWAAWAPEAKPASWSSWSEAKPWSSYVSPIQPAFYGASWGQPAVSTNAHHAIPTPWSSAWSSAHPVSWTEPIQKRSERKPF